MAQSPAIDHGLPIPVGQHSNMKYLDVHHVLRPRGVEIQGTAADLRQHLFDHHKKDVTGLGSIRALAKWHLIIHALSATE